MDNEVQRFKRAYLDAREEAGFAQAEYESGGVQSARVDDHLRVAKIRRNVSLQRRKPRTPCMVMQMDQAMMMHGSQIDGRRRLRKMLLGTSARASGSNGQFTCV